MHDLMGNDERTEATVMQAMVLFSSLTTAAEVWHAAEERRAGRDPSTLEAERAARAYLGEACQELHALLARLRASLARTAGGEDAHAVALVRRLSDVMVLRRVGRLLHIVHQRLLSLYPAVEETLIEEARALRNETDRLLEAEDGAFLEALEAYVRRALGFAMSLQDQLGAPSSEDRRA